MTSRFFLTRIRKWLFHLAVVVAIFAFAFWLTQYAQDNSHLQNLVYRYGYLGVFLISILGGLNIVFPVPAVSFVPLFIESGLSLWLVIFLMTLGTTTADMVAYIIGIVGRKAVSESYDSKLVRRLDRLKKRYYWSPIFVLFLYAIFVPLPNEILLIPLGFLGYHVRHILPAVLVGNAIFTIVASHGVIGIFSLL